MQPSPKRLPAGGKPGCEASLERVRDGGCEHAVVAAGAPWWHGAWWPWMCHSSKVHGGHGHTIVAQCLVAMDVPWCTVAIDTPWRVAGTWWPQTWHGGCGGITPVGHSFTMMATEASWWPWTYRGSDGHTMVAGCLVATVASPVLRMLPQPVPKAPQLVAAPLPAPARWVQALEHSQTMSR